jgi:hypothetical protein
VPNRAKPDHATPASPLLAYQAMRTKPCLPCRPTPNLVWQLHTSPHLPSRSRYCRSPPSGPCLRSLAIHYRVPHRHAMPATPWRGNPLLPRLPVRVEPSPAIAASPAAPFLSVPTKPCRPRQFSPLRPSLANGALPANPCQFSPVPTSPRLRCRALHSPTTPSPPRQWFPPQATPCRP